MYSEIRSDDYDVNNILVIRPDDPLEGRLGSAVSSHLSIDLNLDIIDIIQTQFYLNLKSSNIFDVEICYPTTTGNPAFDKGTLGRGRTFLITLGWNFD